LAKLERCFEILHISVMKVLVCLVSKRYIIKVFVFVKESNQMKIEQTSNLIKVPNRIQGFVNVLVSTVKINSIEIATPSAVARSNHVDKRQQVW
jgi:hypothetical protein